MTFGGGAGGGGGFNLGSAYGEIIINTDGIEGAIRRAQNAFQAGIDSIGASVTQLGDRLTGLGSALTVLTSPLQAFGQAGLGAAADFDVLMTQIEIFGGVTGDNLLAVRDYALEMGAATQFSSADAAAALLDLLRSGMSLEDAMASLPAVLDLAAAGEMSLAEAAGITSSALATFGLGAGDATRVSDALARAANASRADIAGLGQALNNVAPVANQFGLSIEETAAVLGVFSNAGIQGAEAGTQMRSMLMNMYSTVPDVTEAWDELGVSLYDSEGNMRDFNTVIQEMDAALDQLPLEDQNRILMEIGGHYGIVGLNALRAAGGIDEMLTAMDGAPAASDLAQAFMDTFRGAIESLQGSIETLQIVALTPLMNEVLRPLVERITAVVNALTSWIQANPALANQIIRVLALVVTLGPTLFGVGRAISAIGTIITFFTSGILGPLFLALGALYFAFETNFLGIRDTVQPLIDAFGMFFSAVGAGTDPITAFTQTLNAVFGAETTSVITGFLSNIVNSIGAFVALMSEAFRMASLAFGTYTDVVNDGGSVIDGIIAAVEGALRNFLLTVGLLNPEDWQVFRDAVTGALHTVWNVLSGIATFVLDTVIPNLQALVQWFIADGLPLALSFINDTALPIIQGFIDFIAAAWDAVSPALTILADWFLNTALPAIVGFINDTVSPAIQNFIGFLTGLWEQVSPGLTALAQWFTQDAMPMIAAIINDIVIPAIELMVDVLSDIWTTVSPYLLQFWDWFTVTGLPLVTDFITNTVVPIVSDFISLLAGIWDAISPTLSSVFDWFMTTGLPAISDFISTTVQPVIDTFISVLSTIWDVVSIGLTALHDWWQQTFVAQWLSSITGEQGIQTVIQGFIDVVEAIWDTISPALQSVYNWFSTNFPGIVRDFIQPMINAIGGIVDAVTDAIAAIQDMDEVWSGIQDNANTISEGVASGQWSAGDVWNAAVNAIGDEFGFAEGGWTGSGASNEVAGMVHRNEYVVPENGALVMRGGGGDTYNIYLQVPVEVLRDEPNLERNAERFADTFQEALTAGGMRRGN